jgi:hypothetical protein
MVGQGGMVFKKILNLRKKLLLRHSCVLLIRISILQCFRAPLRCALASGSEEGIVYFRFPGIYSSARDARLGNMPGYYEPSLRSLCHSNEMDGYRKCVEAVQGCFTE